MRPDTQQQMQDEQNNQESTLELELDPVAEQFFSSPPTPPAWLSAHDDWQAEPLTSLERVAMLTTAAPGMAMLAVGLTLLLCSL